MRRWGRLLFVGSALLFASHASAATTRTMSSCSEDAWDAAYASAQSGDTVAFPVGPCTLTMTKSIGKANLTIQGRGEGVSIVNGGFTGSGASANGGRITGIEFRGGLAWHWKGSPSSRLQDFRIDHCVFREGPTFIELDGATVRSMVVDHTTYAKITSSANRIFGQKHSTETFPFVLGTDEGVYFEDNVVTNAKDMAHFIASRAGSRYVVRHNSFTVSHWDTLDAHDNNEQKSERGSFTWEVYENRFVFPNDSNNNTRRVIHMRGGQGVIFNNYFNYALPRAINLNSYMMMNGVCERDEPECSEHINHTYVWGNKDDCGSDLVNCAGGTLMDVIVYDQGPTRRLIENVDYWLSAAPGYVPYTYPHPRTGESAPVCTVGETRSCYTGPAQTAGVGVCQQGTQTCAAGGWGACIGEVLPSEEVCGDGIDQDCSEADLTCTCAAQGGACCSETEVCTGEVMAASDCDACCVGGSCSSSTPAFSPGECIEAEEGELTAPMAVVSDSAASGGGYVAATSGSGIASFEFAIVEAGEYLLQVVVHAPSSSQNSFYVGLDDEAAQGSNAFIYGPPVTSSFAWDNVATQGSNPLSQPPQNDPKIFALTAGRHSVQIYGREAGTRLDKLILKRCPASGCSIIANDLGCGCQSGTSRACYSGPEGTEGVGVCAAGTQQCSAGVWGACSGEVLPGEEVWNELDDACDGEVDEGCLPTCAQLQGSCCGSGEECQGTLQPSADCASCCVGGTCSPASPAFSPDTCIEAEEGELTAPMAVASDSAASGGAYVAATSGSGSVRFECEVVEAGEYLLQALIHAPTSSQNSFYVGLDGEAAQGSNAFVYGPPVTSSFAWDNVATQGSNPLSQPPQNDPKVFALTAGRHGIQIYGREAGTRLDKLILKRCPDSGCSGIANDLGCGCQSGTSRACYSGPEGTQGVGVCSAGTQTCQSPGWTACSGEVLPAEEQCDNGLDDDCDGEADEGCERTFAVGECVEAESGELTAPMATASNSGASGGIYVASTAGNAGVASFEFSVDEAGDYVLQARVVGPSGSSNSFFVGLDNEAAQGSTPHYYGPPGGSAFVWDHVSKQGNVALYGTPQFDPMVWTLSPGRHSFQFHGREAGTRLDMVVLKRCSTTGCASLPALGCGASASALRDAAAESEAPATQALGCTAAPGGAVGGPALFLLLAGLTALRRTRR